MLLNVKKFKGIGRFLKRNKKIFLLVLLAAMLINIFAPAGDSYKKHENADEILLSKLSAKINELERLKKVLWVISLCVALAILFVHSVSSKLRGKILILLVIPPILLFNNLGDLNKEIKWNKKIRRYAAMQPYDKVNKEWVNDSGGGRLKAVIEEPKRAGDDPKFVYWMPGDYYYKAIHDVNKIYKTEAEALLDGFIHVGAYSNY